MIEEGPYGEGGGGGDEGARGERNKETHTPILSVDEDVTDLILEL